ncbi:hypothetical protein CEXT_672181 [Caerostris extrusa]|uniref:Uncharacterized protein n=1 Tax=Caerostris extrusa TaxID=172846 RepID=A0AAV4NDZ8_CAEEX|nr:hypothetical protein CEXT_672181 [Caerostris extrusa]
MAPFKSQTCILLAVKAVRNLNEIGPSLVVTPSVNKSVQLFSVVETATRATGGDLLVRVTGAFGRNQKADRSHHKLQGGPK